jgi:hypothetical protein
MVMVEYSRRRFKRVNITDEKKGTNAIIGEQTLES